MTAGVMLCDVDMVSVNEVENDFDIDADAVDDKE